MNTKVKTVVGIGLFVVFLIAASLLYNALSKSYQPDTQIKLAENTEKQETEVIAAPDFTVFDADGNAVKLSDFKGKPIVLNFWASWCPPCKGEMPHFDKVYKDVKDDVVFVMVDLVDGQRETQEKGQKYVSDQGFEFPVYFDTNQEAAATYGISSIPTTLFIDADGNIVNGYEGGITEKQLTAAIDDIKK